MIKYLLFLSLFFVSFQNQLSAQASGNVQHSGNAPQEVGNYRYTQPYQNRNNTAVANWYNDNLSIIEVNAMKNVEADTYTAIFHITQIAKTAEDVDKLVNERIDGFKAELLRAGIPANAIFIDMLTFIPLYELEVEKKVFSKRYNEIPKGFEMKKNVHITYKDGNDLDKIVTAAAKNEIYDLVKVDYFVKNTAAIYEELRTKSLAIAQKKVAHYKALGLNLEVYTMVEATAVSFPIDNYRQYQAFTSVSLEKNLDKDKINSVRKNTTLFYNAIDAKKFDIVINPDILEPTVQYTYNMKVKYIIKRPEKPQPPKPAPPTVQKQFYIIAPDGSYKLLPTN